MLDLAVREQTANQAVLALAGWASGASVPLLEQEVARHTRPDRRLVLDLYALRFVDEAGLDLLEGWVRDGLELRGGSHFVRKLLEQRGLESG